MVGSFLSVLKMFDCGSLEGNASLGRWSWPPEQQGLFVALETSWEALTITALHSHFPPTLLFHFKSCFAFTFSF